jgi:hypothetical protein
MALVEVVFFRFVYGSNDLACADAPWTDKGAFAAKETVFCVFNGIVQIPPL